MSSAFLIFRGTRVPRKTRHFGDINGPAAAAKLQRKPPLRRSLLPIRIIRRGHTANDTSVHRSTVVTVLSSVSTVLQFIKYEPFCLKKQKKQSFLFGEQLLYIRFDLTFSLHEKVRSISLCRYTLSYNRANSMRDVTFVLIYYISEGCFKMFLYYHTK